MGYLRSVLAALGMLQHKSPNAMKSQHAMKRCITCLALHFVMQNIFLTSFLVPETKPHPFLASYSPVEPQLWGQRSAPPPHEESHDLHQRSCDLDPVLSQAGTGSKRGREVRSLEEKRGHLTLWFFVLVSPSPGNRSPAAFSLTKHTLPPSHSLHPCTMIPTSLPPSLLPPLTKVSMVGIREDP